MEDMKWIVWDVLFMKVMKMRYGIEHYLKASRQMVKETTFNLDLYMIHSDEYQDLILAYPYGVNLPEGELDNSETTNITVTKNWDDENDRDGIRPDKITVTLYADGVAKETVSFGEDDGWMYQFIDLPKNKDDGSVIVYTVEETTVSGYELTQENIYKEE